MNRAGSKRAGPKRAGLDTDPGSLRTASLRLSIRFATLIVALFLVVAGVVIALVATSEHEALTQSLMNAEHLAAPTDAGPGVFVATSAGPAPGQGPGQDPGQGQTQSQATPGTQSQQAGDAELQVSPNAPSGFPDTSAITKVTRTGVAIQQTKTLGGDRYVVRTSSQGGRVVQVAVNLSQSQAQLRRVIIALALAGLPALAGAVLAAWWMSRRAMRPLADALALQRRFVADAGHELRTPLTLLSTRAQLLRRAVGEQRRDETGRAAQVSADGVRGGLDEIVSDAKALTAILEDLLVSADPRQDADRADVDLAALVDEVTAAVRSDAAERGIAVERKGEASVTVSGVRVAISRLILALLSNALDHASARVEVVVSVHDGEARLEVRDDGPGFPAGAADRAFERFASSRPAETDASGQRHYGLGLALVAEVAHRHGGSVAILDTAGQGALIRVQLPALV